MRGMTIHACLIAVGALMLYPLIWMTSSSFTPTEDIFSNSGLLPVNATVQNYVDGWFALTRPFGRYLLNSLVIVAGAIFGNLLSCSLAAFAFARMTFRWKPVWFAIMLGTIMLPIQVIVIPQYILFTHAGWINTYLPLVVPKLLGVDAFFIFLMVQFIRGLPKELDDAARIDGCGPFGIYWRIVLPLMTPALVTTAIFTFIWTWNDFFSQLVFLTDPDMFTVPVALRTFVDSSSATPWGSVFAMSVLSIVPVLLFFVVGQKYLVRGIATTGLK